MSGWEPFLNAIGKYSWRSMFGVFVAAGIVLFFSGPLGIYDWAHPLRPWLIGAFALSGAVLLSHVGTLIHDTVGQRRQVDLRLVAGNPGHCRWYIGAVGQTPTMVVQVAMNFAHNQKGLSVHIKRAYLKGTTEATRTFEVIVDGPSHPEEMISMHLLPIKGRPGRKLAGRVVFVDQFNDQHVSEKITFIPQSVPLTARGNQPLNCFFCHKTVEPDQLAQEAIMPAHIKCVWG